MPHIAKLMIFSQLFFQKTTYSVKEDGGSGDEAGPPPAQAPPPGQPPQGIVCCAY